MSALRQPRQPRGVPAGGQFAQSRRPDAGVSLGNERALAERSPVSVDTELVEWLRTQQQAIRRLATAWDAVHREVGDRRASYRAPWQRTDQECRRIVEDGASRTDVEDWARRRAQRLLADVKEHTAALKEANVHVDELEREYQRRGWSRFFQVQGGHIHSSRSCSTCRPTTQFGFAAHLSGSSEADAVADLGPTMCTVCFPSAPVEWTRGLPDTRPVPCPGSGKPPAGEVRHFGMSQYAACSVCGDSQMVTGYGTSIRKHRPKT